MPVTFGSVGDIISLCMLIKDLVDALNGCQKSSHSFQQLVLELQSLERALLEVELLVRKHEASAELNALCVATSQIITNCRRCTEPFLRRVKTYQQTLRPGGSGNRLKDVSRKMQWKMLRKDEVDVFYAEISAHTGSLNMLLITWSM